jgi:hypothetical protein
MTTKEKIEILSRLLKKADGLETQSAGSSFFLSWKNQVESNFIKIFGESSIQLKQLNKLNFTYKGITISGYDYTNTHRTYYMRALETLVQSISNYIEDLQEEIENDNSEILQGKIDTNITKIFISHSSLDKEIVEELIEILESIGLNSSQIFCSSFKGYGIDFGENFLERIKNELDHNVLVLFMLSNNFYQSPVCLCEMGATWIKTNLHIPILIPPFEFKDVKGVIPLTHGFIVNDKNALNQFKSQIENTFGISNKLDISTWETKRDRIVNRMNC